MPRRRTRGALSSPTEREGRSTRRLPLRRIFAPTYAHPEFLYFVRPPYPQKYTTAPVGTADVKKNKVAVTMVLRSGVWPPFLCAGKHHGRILQFAFSGHDAFFSHGAKRKRARDCRSTLASPCDRIWLSKTASFCVC